MTAMFIGLRAAGIKLDVAGSLFDHVRDDFQKAGIGIVDLDIRSRVDRAAIRRLRAELDKVLAREGRTELAAACFAFLSTRAALDLQGWSDVDIFAHH